VRHRPRSLEDSERRSPLIIKNLNPYPQPPNQHPLTNTQQRRTTRGLCDRCLSSCGWLRRHRCWSWGRRGALWGWGERWWVGSPTGTSVFV